MAGERKVILISGGSRGLGKAFVESAIAHEHRVYTFSRKRTQFIDEMENGPLSKLFTWESIDGTDFDTVDSYVDRIFETEQRLDALVNNAGMAVDGVLTLMKPSDISGVISLNLEGCIRLARACSKHMLMRRSGVIINVSSIIGIRGYSGLAVYSATKAGLDGFTRGLARELGPRGIRVNSIAPGYIDTDMSSKLDGTQKQQIVRRTPLGRLGVASDITGMVNFLVSDESKFITGQTLVIDGGITC